MQPRDRVAMGLRERKREQTHTRLTLAAYRLFEEHGYEDTTVEMIADAAGVSPRTFYRYFESKDAVLAGSGFDVVDEALARAGHAPTVGTLVRQMALVLEERVAEHHYDTLLRLLRENPHVAARSPLWRKRWAEHLAQSLAAAEGQPEPSLSHHVMSTTALGIVSTALDTWLRGRPSTALTDLVATSMRHLAGQFDEVPPPGR